MPPLFLIFDQREVVTPGNTVSLYGDDCKTSRLINCPADHSLFQTNIKEDIIAEEYCKKRPPLLSNLHLNISTLQRLTFELCDLGLISKSMQPRWNNHIDKITTKANKNLLKELLVDFKMFLL